MAVVMVVSLRVGHVTFAASERTCCRNSNGFVFAIFALRSQEPDGPPARIALSPGPGRPKLTGARSCFEPRATHRLSREAPAITQAARFVDSPVTSGQAGGLPT